MIAFGSVRQMASMTPISACIFAVSSFQAPLRAVSARAAPLLVALWPSRKPSMPAAAVLALEKIERPDCGVRASWAASISMRISDFSRGKPLSTLMS